MEKIREFDIDGENYNLTVKRSLVLSINKAVPELIDLKNGQTVDNVDIAIKLYDNMDYLFYEMIKIKHPNLTREESDVIFEKFCNKYNKAEESLIELMTSVFQQGIPNTKKENLNWF